MALTPHPPLLSSFFWLLHPSFFFFFLLFCPYCIHYFLSVILSLQITGVFILKLRFSSFHFPPTCYCSTCILSLFHPYTCKHMELKTNLLRDQLQNYIHLPNIAQVTSMPQQILLTQFCCTGYLLKCFVFKLFLHALSFHTPLPAA